jgi:2-dehydropantoate 2-reductase
MKFMVYGAGAVGGYLGALLAYGGHEVVLVSRSRATEYADKGLKLIRASKKEIVVQPTAVATLRQALSDTETTDVPYDYILLTMKSYDLQNAIDELIAFAPDNTIPFVTFQNGIGLEERLADAFADELVIAGTLTAPVTLNEYNDVVEERGDRGVALASMVPGRTPRKLVEAFRGAGIDTAVVKDYRSLKWSKALINVIGNATAAITNRHPARLYKYKPTFKLEVRMLKEILAVMDELGIDPVDLPGTPTKWLIRGLKWVPEGIFQSQMTRQVEKGRGDKLPSFQIDLLAGKTKNEVLFHNGAVNLIGSEIGVPTVVNGALTDILLQIVHQEVDWKVYDGKPKELVRAVNEHIRQQRSA